MTGFVSLDGATGWLLITFPYDKALVDLVKTLPGRRWDPARKAWLVPREAAPMALECFRPRNFSFAPEVLELLDEKEDPSPQGESPEGALTVSQLNYLAKTALNRAFPDPVWLVGEVNRLRESARGHVYLELVEKLPEGEGVAARVAGILYQEDYLPIRDKLIQAGGLVLSNDLEVRVLVQVDLYPPRGSYQVRILDIDPYFTLGKLAARREEILARLAEEGLLERNRLLPWPRLPLRIALVTSWESNAFHDFTGVLAKSGYAFRVDVFDARVQGRSLEGDVLRALAYFEENAREYDVLVLVRGGGSASDLAWFDNLAVARAAARHPLKILVGIGHTLDRTVLDEVAHSARTPTEAGEILVEKVRSEVLDLERTALAVPGTALEILERERGLLPEVASRARRALKVRLAGEREILRQGARRAGKGTLLLLALEKRSLASAAPRLVRLARNRLAAPAGEVRLLGRRILREAGRRVLREEEALKGEEKRLSFLDPARILERGYALVRDSLGKVVKSVRQVRPGDSLEVEVADGRFAVEVGGPDGSEEEEP